ncbi:hypothetical protein CN095_35980, partial [Sinorhizobium meliloti]
HKLITSTLLALSCLTSTVNAAENKPLTVAMTTWVGYGLLHLAQQKGFFNEQGVDVSLTTVQDKPATAAAIATGRPDGWATTVDTFIFYNAKKLGIKQVLAVDFSKGGEGIVAAGDIKTVADLKGAPSVQRKAPAPTFSCSTCLLITASISRMSSFNRCAQVMQGLPLRQAASTRPRLGIHGSQKLRNAAVTFWPVPLISPA